MDLWDGETYGRVLAVQGKPLLVRVTQSGGVSVPRLHITASATYLPAVAKTVVAAALGRLLGLGVDMRSFYRMAAEHRRLHELARRFRGLKPPRFPTVWEGLVNGIACQQFSLTVGILLLNRLTALCGLPWGKDAVRHAFPRPEDLGIARPESLRSLGFNRAKSGVLTGLGKEIASGQLDLESFASLANAEATSRLLELPGVGRWTAEYILLRGMGRIDVFPGDDVGARNNLARWLHLRHPLDYGRVTGIVERWKPYGGLVYFHLLLDGLERAGYLRRRCDGPNHNFAQPRPAPAGSAIAGSERK